MVDGLVKKGYAVAFADYQGLGAPGVHPYLDNKTEGLNIIDSVRALRHTFPDISNRWAALGGSQGGGAVWAADELAGSYAPELELVGAVAMAPAADVTGIVDKAAAGTLTYYQGPALQSVVETLARLHPELNRDDYRRGAAAEYWDVLSSCSGAKGLDARRRQKRWSPPTSRRAHPRPPIGCGSCWRSGRCRSSRSRRRCRSPTAARTSYIDAQWTTDAIARQCALGGIVVWDLQQGQGSRRRRHSLSIPLAGRSIRRKAGEK